MTCSEGFLGCGNHIYAYHNKTLLPSLSRQDGYHTTDKTLLDMSEYQQKYDTRGSC